MKTLLLGLIMLMLAGCRAFPTGYRPAATEPPVETDPLPYEVYR
jgi:starvation-inducible outer membrane lipoprotein